MPVFAVAYGLAEGPEREGRAARLKAAAWAQTPERPLFDATPGFTLLESSATSQGLVEALAETAGLGAADWVVVLNLTYPEQAAYGLPAPERFAYMMMLRDESRSR